MWLEQIYENALRTDESYEHDVSTRAITICEHDCLAEITAGVARDIPIEMRRKIDFEVRTSPSAEKNRDYMRVYFQTHKEYCRRKSLEWAHNHKEQVNEQRRKRYKRMKGELT